MKNNSTKNNLSTSKSKTPQSVQTLFEVLKAHKHDESFINNLMKKEETSNIIKTILEKEERQIPEVYILKTYLYSLKKFMEIIDTGEENLKIDSVLVKVSKELRSETFEKNSFLMRIGEKGHNFYVTLSGSVNILVPKEYTVYLNRDQYLCYLKFLYNNKENYILNKTFLSNDSVFLIDKDEFEQFDQRYELQNIPLEEYLLFTNGKKDYEDYFENQINKKDNNLIYDDFIDDEEILKKKRNKRRGPEILYKPYKVKIYGYSNVVELGIGSTFGEVALTKLNNQRTATVFVKEKSVFGTLTVQAFKQLMKIFLEKIKRVKIFFVFSTPLFKNLYMNDIVKSYWNYFAEKKIEKGDFLFKNGDTREQIYFLQKGTFKLYIPQCTYSKIESILCDIKNIYYDEKIFSEEQKDIIISIVDKGEILGMGDCTIEDNFFCNAICESDYAVYFSIDLKVIYKIINEYNDIKNNWKDLQDNKIKFILNRLENIKRAFANSVEGEIKQGENYRKINKIENFFNNEVEIVLKKKGKKNLDNVIFGNINLEKRKNSILKEYKYNGNKLKNKLKQNSLVIHTQDTSFFKGISPNINNVKFQFNPYLNIKNKTSRIKTNEQSFSKNENSQSILFNSTLTIKNRNYFGFRKKNFSEDKNSKTSNKGINLSYLKKLLHTDDITKALFENRLKNENIEKKKNINDLTEIRDNRKNFPTQPFCYEDNSFRHKTINTESFNRIKKKKKYPSFYYYGKLREKYSKLYEGKL